MARYIGILIILFSVISLGWGQQVVLTKKGLKLNGKKITENTTAEDVENIIGEADVVYDLLNTIHTYDDLGIYVYFTPSTGKFNSFAFNFDYEDYEFSPKKLFKGTFKVGGKTISANTVLQDMKKVKGSEGPEEFMGVWYIYTYYDMSIYFSIGGEGQITSVSINYKDEG